MILRIYSYQDKIYYWCNRHLYYYMHVPTVRYIYHLMSLMDHAFWMNVIIDSHLHYCGEILAKHLHNEMSTTSP